MDDMDIYISIGKEAAAGQWGCRLTIGANLEVDGSVICIVKI